MTSVLDNVAKTGRTVATFEVDEPAVTSRLVESDEGRGYLVWQGPSSWVD